MAATQAPAEPAPLMPAPTLQESIEQTLLAARLTPSVEERTSLFVPGTERDLAPQVARPVE